MPETPKIKATACVGYRKRDVDGPEARERILDIVKDSVLNKFEHYCIAPDWYEGPHQPFNRAQAKNLAAHLAKQDGYDEVLFFVDADCYVPEYQLRYADVALTMANADIALAHNGRAVYMSSGQKRGMGENGIPAPFPGGIFAIKRALFDEMGGFDEKFLGWGHEDLCFLWSAQNIFNAHIMLSNSPDMGPLYKLDMLHSRYGHEQELQANPDTQDGILYAANTALRDRYLTLTPGDRDGYWALKNEKTEGK